MDVPELVENMLLQLPLRKILLVQQVCKTWKDVIETSPQIQKALFFRPSADIQLRLVETRGVYPLPCRKHMDCPSYTGDGHKPTDDESGFTRWAQSLSDESLYRILVNPFLRSCASEPGGHRYIRREDHRFDRDVYERPEASWRKMLLTQPPLAEAIVRSCGDETMHWHILQAKKNPKGLTLGDARSHARKFGHGLRRIWGEDGFAALPLGGANMPADVSGQVMIDEIKKEPKEEVDDQSTIADEEGDSGHEEEDPGVNSDGSWS